jgi:cytochrome d ubiquinol oxidase subunit II
MDLNLIWFLLLGVLLAGYAILDGFDLGVGILHPFVPRNDTERRISINSIGPLWDGNEVWLVTFGGALFAAFPNAYATIFSGFYTALMILLFALILRAVSMEFRSKHESTAWRRLWDQAFFLGSAVATLLFGVAVGNAMMGLPLSAAGDFTGTLFDQLNPFALIVGLLAVALFAMHGSIYLYLKTEGDYQEKIRPWMWRTFFGFLFLYLLTSAYALAAVPSATANFKHYPWAAVVPVLNVLAVANIPRAIHLGRPGYAFLSSCATILALTFLLAVAIFPNLVASSTPAVGPSLTIYNSASSPKTLGIMLIIAAVGMPCVLAYTTVIYWTFRGKVHIGEHSY